MQTKMKYILSLSLLVSCILNSYASQLDTRVREYLAPIRIVWQQNTDLMNGTENLFRKGNGQPDLVNAYMCVMRSEMDENHQYYLISEKKFKVVSKLLQECRLLKCQGLYVCVLESL